MVLVAQSVSSIVCRRYRIIVSGFLVGVVVASMVAVLWPVRYRATRLLRVGTVDLAEPVVDAATTAAECAEAKVPSAQDFQGASAATSVVQLRCEAIYLTDLVRVIGQGPDPRVVKEAVGKLADTMVREQNALIARIRSGGGSSREALSRPAVIVGVPSAAHNTKPGMKIFLALAVFLGAMFAFMLVSIVEGLSCGF